MARALRKSSPEGASPDTSNGPSDGDCLVGIAMGDHACFNELLSRYQDRVVNLINRLVGDWNMALDLGQEVFLRIHRRASTFRPEGNARSWILAVAVNVGRDYLRSRRQRILYLDRVEGMPTLDTGRAGPATPPEILEREELRQRVHEVLQDLPEFHRTMLVLRDFEGLSYLEMGEIFSCEVGTVKSRLHRARKQFEELFNRKRMGGTA